jgi:hypothetical protein
MQTIDATLRYQFMALPSTTSGGRRGTAPVLILAGCLTIVAVALLAPGLGTKCMEVGFPFLGAWFLFRKSPDRFACHSAYLGIYLLWFWLGSIPILNGDQTLSLMNSFDDRQWLFYLLGFLGYFCGTMIFPAPQGSPEDIRGLQLRWRDGQFLVFLLVVAVAIVVAWGMITSEEGIPIFQNDVDTLRIEISTRHRYAFQLLVVLSDLLLPLMFL